MGDWYTGPPEIVVSGSSSDDFVFIHPVAPCSYPRHLPSPKPGACSPIRPVPNVRTNILTPFQKQSIRTTLTHKTHRRLHLTTMADSDILTQLQTSLDQVWTLFFIITSTYPPFSLPITCTRPRSPPTTIGRLTNNPLSSSSPNSSLPSVT